MASLAILDQYMTPADCEMFIRNYKDLCYAFSEDIVHKISATFKVRDFTQLRWVEKYNVTDYYDSKNYPKKNENHLHMFNESKVEWSRDV